MVGYKEINGKKIPEISTKIDFSDIFGEIKARWGINRMNYQITPDIYCIGNPTKDSPVFVTANYKLSLDKLRKELVGLDCFILVLDTKGINVWCAAGKGTFGTEELIQRINKVNLSQIVNHKTLILPQLGAVGVSYMDIKKQTGFNVIYGPVLAKDIKPFLLNNYNKTKEMRTVNFTFKDRITVAPIEFVATIYLNLIVLAIFTLFNLIFYTKQAHFKIWLDFIPFFTAIISGTFLIPILLPYIPGKAFAIKGLILGLVVITIINFLFNLSIFGWISNYFILVPIVSFLAMNFTGATTFTSLSGATLEVTKGVPIMAISLVIGLVLRVLLETKIII
ncbi:MAG: hypothetical protein A2086_03585 [Spirochaetes bacterium GWD1_27_9]|nr:MAG: hypothetical protein A2Z98_11335 [Spirochaetes bacterium GWB1_27_13]OHD32803.1 MAG: hypothetical protein A2086_03585 [Spirochaetes bacterium GWD1_27_9]